MQRLSDVSQSNDLSAYVPVFVGGVPRTGTTLISALISTSKSCNAFVPEHHYLCRLTDTLAFGINQFDEAHKYFFRSQEKLVEHHMNFINTVINEAWLALGKPKLLVIKHPNITPMFGMFAQYMPSAKFVVSIRDARDVIASLQRAVSRAVGMDRPLTEPDLKQAIDKFNNFYTAILGRAESDLKGKLLALKYETLAHGDFQGLGPFLGIDDLRPEQVWESDTFNVNSYDGHYMQSDLWGKKLTTLGIGRYRETLSEEIANRVILETWSTTVAFSTLLQDSAEAMAVGAYGRAS